MDSKNQETIRKRKPRNFVANSTAIFSSCIDTSSDMSAVATGGDLHDEFWDCTVCTYRNSAEAFRCDMCQTRKGTSTRKPKLNRQIVEEQNLIARAILKEQRQEAVEGSGGDSFSGHGRKRGRHSGSIHAAVVPSSSVLGSLIPTALIVTGPKNDSIALSRSLTNVDRSTPMQFEVFANGFSVVITEYQAKVPSDSINGASCKEPFCIPHSPAPSNSSSTLGFSSTPIVSGSSAAATQPTIGSVSDLPSPSMGDERDVATQPLTPAIAKRLTSETTFSGSVAASPSTSAVSVDIISPKSATTTDDDAPLRKRRKKRARRRLQNTVSSTTTPTSTRSLRSSSEVVLSRNRRAGRLTRTSLYRSCFFSKLSGDTKRNYVRRKERSFSTISSANNNHGTSVAGNVECCGNVASSAAPQVANNADTSSFVTTEGLSANVTAANNITTDNTTAMTDSCGALQLEMTSTAAECT